MERDIDKRTDLERLEDLDEWELQDENQDIRGRMLVSRSGDAVGRISQLLVDRARERVAAVRLESGEVLPVEPLIIRDDVVIFGAETPKERRERELRKEEFAAAKEELAGRRFAEGEGVRVRSRAPIPAAVIAAPPPPPPEPAPAPPPPPPPRVETESSAGRKTSWDWNKIGIGAAVIGAAALMIGRKGHKDDFQLRLETDENLRLISSTKVEGTAVFGSNGERLGHIDSFMVDKYTGRVAYAVMKFGGMMGFGSSLFPIPWPLLEYDVATEGYALDVTKEQLAKAPRFEESSRPNFDPAYRRDVLNSYQGSD